MAQPSSRSVTGVLGSARYIRLVRWSRFSGGLIAVCPDVDVLVIEFAIGIWTAVTALGSVGCMAWFPGDYCRVTTFASRRLSAPPVGRSLGPGFGLTAHGVPPTPILLRSPRRICQLLARIGARIVLVTSGSAHLPGGPG